MSKVYTMKKSNKGYIAMALEMTVKDVLHRKNPDRLSPCGTCDFRYNHHNYEVKQNGGVLKYSPTQRVYIKGANKVVYATHCAYEIVAETDETVDIRIDLANTDLYVVDKTEFIEFLKSVNGMRWNSARNQVNIQTCYNYKKQAYHGKLGKLIEEWCYEHENDEDDIIGTILDRLD